MSASSSSLQSVTAVQAYEALLADPRAQLVDVRTQAEWTFVGIPDLSAAGRKPILAEWLTFPERTVDTQFAERLGAALEQAGLPKSTPLYFLCRSGARSLAAGEAMRAAGYKACINIEDGFEGDLDAQGHRGSVNGWKASGLPWTQS